MTTIKINQSTNHNYFRYPMQAQPQPAYIQLDCEEGLLFSEYNGEIGAATPFTIHHRQELRWNINIYLRVDSINELLEEIKPLAQEIVNGYESVHDGSNWVGKFTDEAEKAIEQVKQSIRCFRKQKFSMICDWEEWFVDGWPMAVETLSSCKSAENFNQLVAQNMETQNYKIESTENPTATEWIVEQLNDTITECEGCSANDLARLMGIMRQLPSWLQKML